MILLFRDYRSLRYPWTGYFRCPPYLTSTSFSVCFRPHVEHSYGDNLECTLTLEDSQRTCTIKFQYIHVNERQFGIKMIVLDPSRMIDKLTDHVNKAAKTEGDVIIPDKSPSQKARWRWRFDRYKEIPRETTRYKLLWTLDIS